MAFWRTTYNAWNGDKLLTYEFRSGKKLSLHCQSFKEHIKSVANFKSAVTTEFVPESRLEDMSRLGLIGDYQKEIEAKLNTPQLHELLRREYTGTLNNIKQTVANMPW